MYGKEKFAKTVRFNVDLTISIVHAKSYGELNDVTIETIPVSYSRSDMCLLTLYMVWQGQRAYHVP